MKTVSDVCAAACKVRKPVKFSLDGVTFEDRPPVTTVTDFAVRNYRNLVRGANRLACLDRSVAHGRFVETARVLTELYPGLKARPGSFEDAYSFLNNIRREFVQGLGVSYMLSSLHVNLWRFSDREYAHMRFFPIYIDHHRYAFYQRAAQVAESVLVRLLCVSTWDGFVRGIDAVTFSLVRREEGTDIWCGTSHPQFASYWPMSLAQHVDSSVHAVYSYDVLGCRFEDPLFFYLSELSRSIWFTTLHSQTVMSFALPCKPSIYSEFNRKRPGFGKTGEFLGMILPKDEEGRTVVVLPSKELSLPRETRVQETVTAMRSLYGLLTGDEPVWLTPAGRTAWDQLEWE